MESRTIGNVLKINIYPIKSGAPIALRTARLTPEGLEGDREFMVVSNKTEPGEVHPFISQREIPRMALLRPENKVGGLELTWVGKNPILVAGASGYSGKEIVVRVWESIMPGVVQRAEVNTWLSDHLGASVKLVRADGKFHRGVSNRYMVNGNTVRFQDGYPVHWFTLASVFELSEKAGQEISWDRFRPNIVVVGGAPQVEHLVLNGTIGTIPFVDPKPCDRCSITTVDPQTGEPLGKEPLATLNAYKRWRNKEGKPKVIFGENMLPLESGMINIGDTIRMESVRDPPLEYG